MSQPYHGDPNHPSQQPGFPSQRKPSGNIPATRPNSRKALRSVILGGLGGLLSFLIIYMSWSLLFPVALGLGSMAVILGHWSLKEIHASESSLEGRGMAIAGLVMGYVILAITALSLLFGLFILLTFRE